MVNFIPPKIWYGDHTIELSKMQDRSAIFSSVPCILGETTGELFAFTDQDGSTGTIASLAAIMSATLRTRSLVAMIARTRHESSVM